MGSQSNQFFLDLPDGWEDRTVHVFMGPDDSGVQHLLTLVVDRNVTADRVEEYAHERIDLQAGSLQGTTVLKEAPLTLPSGVPAYECVYKWIPQDGTVIFKRLIFTIIDGTGYTFTANFSKKTIKTIGVEVEQMIKSFRPAVSGSDR